LILANCVALFGQTRAIETHLAVLSSPDVPSATKQRLTACLQQLLREWKLKEANLPNIVVFQVSKKTAVTAAVEKKVAVRKNSVPGEATGYFELWLVGEPNAGAYVVAFENVLETHFELKPADKERDAVIARVIRRQTATVDVDEGK
jgi:hypothetical protein